MRLCAHYEIGVVQRVSDGRCLLCKRAANRKYKASDKGRVKEREYYHANKASIIVKNVAYRNKNPDKALVAQRARYARDPVFRAKHKAWRDENKDKVRDYARATYRNNPETQRRRKGVHFAATQTVESLRIAQSDRCAICKRQFAELKPKEICVDHDHAISDGSPNVRAILCGACNKGLGMFRDSPQLMREAAAYLEHHSGGGADASP